MRIAFAKSRKLSKTKKPKKEIWFRETSERSSSIGQFFAEARAERRLTLREAAALTGFSNASLSHLETGRQKKITLAQAIRLQAAYGLKWDAILTAQQKEMNED